MTQSHTTPPGAGHIFIECTRTFRYGGNSGIQRVVRNVANNAAAVGAEMGLACRPVVCAGRRFACVERLRADAGAPRAPQRGEGRLSRLRQRLKRIAWLRRLVKVLLPWRLRRAAGALPRAFRDKVLTALAERRYPRVQPGEGDVIVLLDSSWHTPPWHAVDRARRRGAKVGVVIYDLIPIRLPDTCDRHLVNVFGRWLPQAVERADFYVAISNAVKDELLEYLAARPGAAAPPPVGTFRLGAELDCTAGAGPVRAVLRELFAPPPRHYLAVGTIEPRKNHAYLLDAFEVLWARGVDASLCLVGKIGWKCDDLVHRIRAHPQWGRRLSMFNDLCDAELAFCYERARALVFASRAEGFGLPIVEALSRGLTVLASDIPVHRETAGEHAVYFDLSSPASLAGIVRAFERTGALPAHRPPEGFRWLRWRESCRELLAAVRRLAR